MEYAKGRGKASLGALYADHMQQSTSQIAHTNSIPQEAVSHRSFGPRSRLLHDHQLRASTSCGWLSPGTSPEPLGDVLCRLGSNVNPPQRLRCCLHKTGTGKEEHDSSSGFTVFMKRQSGFLAEDDRSAQCSDWYVVREQGSGLRPIINSA
jgi:hypothetical protein